MKTEPGPVLDYFGGRLRPRDLTAGLRALGLTCLRLVVRDGEILLSVSEADAGGELPARALTWLRARFSPLLAYRLETVPASRARALGAEFEDRRRRPLLTVFLAEVWDDADLPAALAGLWARLGGAGGAPARILSDWRETPALRRALAGEKHPCLIGWRRPGGAEGVRSATILAAATDSRALTWLLDAMEDEPAHDSPAYDVLLDGLEWGVARRPTVAAAGCGPQAGPILVDLARCRGCGLCARICPARCLDSGGRMRPDAASSCLGCFDCVEACPQDALRPRYGDSSATLSRALRGREGWLSRLRGAPGAVLPALFPPSFLLPRPGRGGKPRWVLGLSVNTVAEHAAALLDGGAVAGAVEEERLARVRHYGCRPEGRPGALLSVDPTLCLEEVFCRRSIGALLAPRRLTLDDVDLIAVNGIPARYRRAYSLVDPDRPIPSLRAGRVLFVPHHLSHAASAWRASGQKDGWILSVDGRGDRETAAVFRAAKGRIRPVREILSLTDRSIGGVYETVTRLLGFGEHGQGSVMALAAFGKPSFDLAPFLSRRGPGDYVIHEEGLVERFAALARAPGAPLRRGHKDLAASLQAALESFLPALLRDSGVGRGDALGLAGGVALNCRVNEALRRALAPREMFVAPGANDAGTALGAALEAAALLGLPRAPALRDACLGPGFTAAEARAALQHAGLAFREASSPARETAGLLARGEVVCWCQGRMEFGPRALGGRSILADPRRADMQDRVNAVKQREAWRPFGPSILAGHEKDWFSGAFDSRFMLFTLPFKPGRAALVPAVAHVDETSRPQSVHKDVSPLYHELITSFHESTGVPMVLNTSFNRRGEPIVCSPQDAVECFSGMRGADALALGPFIARRPRSRRRLPAPGAALAALPGGRRLMLRLNARCDNDCVHCTLADLAHRQARSFEDALRALAEGRQAGCSELVVMRGEPALWPGLTRLLRRARLLGYRFIQIQTSGRALARPERRRELLGTADAFEITMLGAQPATHDALARAPGAFRETVLGIRAASAAGREVILSVPVLRGNLRELSRIMALAAGLGVKSVQLLFPRPVETAGGLRTRALARLSDAAPYIRAALRAAAALGLAAAAEAVPFCHLEAEQRMGPDCGQDWARFRVDDLDGLRESLDPERADARPSAPACRRCSLRDRCPRTWALYLALFGGAELAAVP